MNQNFRMSLLFIFGYIYSVFGLALTLYIILKNINIYNSFTPCLQISFSTVNIFYVLLLISYYISKKLYCYVYYLLFFFCCWYHNNFLGFLVILILNAIVTLPNYVNLIIFFLIGTGITIDGLYRNKNPKYEFLHLKCENLKGGNLVICHLSDLHLGCIYGKEKVQQVVNMIINCHVRIDIVLITGDLIDGNISVEPEVLAPFDQLICPIYYVTGNHELYTDINQVFRLIDNSNIIRLKNNYITFQNRINIAGIDFDADSQRANEKVKIIMDKIKKDQVACKYPNVLMNHVPIYKPKDLAENNIFLFLCGHLHGGFFFPLNVIMHLLAKDRVCVGLYDYDKKNFAYCSSGIGSNEPMVRGFVSATMGIIQLEPCNDI